MKWIESNGTVVPFLIALLVSGAAFVLMDMAVMNMQGLNLIFKP